MCLCGLLGEGSCEWHVYHSIHEIKKVTRRMHLALKAERECYENQD